MNTFLPFPDFVKSAQCLDNKRLGKQRVEAWQIYLTLKKGEYSNRLVRIDEIKKSDKLIRWVGKTSLVIIRRKTPWYNHPAVQMWKGSECILLLYGIYICEEWIKRGFKDNLLSKFKNELINCKCGGLRLLSPKWLGNEKFHSAMKSNLLRKDKKWYSQFGWKEPDNLPYIWFKEDNLE